MFTKVYSKIVPYNITVDEIRELKPKGIILSGGPQSVHVKDSLMPNPEIFKLELPILGICYGMQAIVHHFGGKVKKSAKITNCQNNLSKLQLAWRTYVDDHDGFMPPNKVVGNSPLTMSPPGSWVVGCVRVDSDDSNLRH